VVAQYADSQADAKNDKGAEEHQQERLPPRCRDARRDRADRDKGECSGDYTRTVYDPLDLLPLVRLGPTQADDQRSYRESEAGRDTDG
jgi:hypothetical protein